MPTSRQCNAEGRHRSGMAETRPSDSVLPPSMASGRAEAALPHFIADLLQVVRRQGLRGHDENTFFFLPDMPGVENGQIVEQPTQLGEFGVDQTTDMQPASADRLDALVHVVGFAVVDFQAGHLGQGGLDRGIGTGAQARKQRLLLVRRVPGRRFGEVGQRDVQGPPRLVAEFSVAKLYGHPLEHLEEVLDPTMAVVQHLQRLSEIRQRRAAQANRNHRDSFQQEVFIGEPMIR